MLIALMRGIFHKTRALGNPNKEKRSIKEGSEPVLKSGVGAGESVVSREADGQKAD